MKTEAEQVLCRFQLSNFIRARHVAAVRMDRRDRPPRRPAGCDRAEGLLWSCGLKARSLEEHTWSISQELPVIVEVVDEPARIEALLAKVEPVFREGVITLERAHVLLYRAGPRRTGALADRPKHHRHGTRPVPRQECAP